MSEHAGPLGGFAAAIATGAEIPRAVDPDQPPFLGGWIVALSYRLGRAIEPRAGVRGEQRPDGGWPRLIMHRCPGAYVHDRRTGTWWAVGAAAAEPDPAFIKDPSAFTVVTRSAFDWGDASAGLDARARSSYERGVARIVEYIRAGDVFQANLAHTLGGRFSGSMRACFNAMIERTAPWFGAYVEDWAGGSQRAAVASMSPELFLDFDPISRVVTTRPIKGTRRGDASPGQLEASGKDHAELAMIVDLMRNDLGRVCDFGSMEVPESRAIERHAAGVDSAGVWHGVATVRGRLRDDAGLPELLRATFPGGSITGAPKVRAMQIIEELEAEPRGLYTGSIGYISDCGRACLNIAIRTALLSGRAASGSHVDVVEEGRWSYGVGAGIVAESDPAAEWEETLAKAEPVLGLGGAYRDQPCPTPAIA